MPKQEITIFNNKDPEKPDLIVVKKTGYSNFWINGVWYYYERKIVYGKIEDADLCPEGRKPRIVIFASPAYAYTFHVPRGVRIVRTKPKPIPKPENR